VPAHFFAAAATKEAMDGNQCPPNAANEGGRPKDAVKRKSNEEENMGQKDGAAAEGMDGRRTAK
jgi:hypothetical protein